MSVQHVRTYRLWRNLSQDELAFFSQVSKRQIQNIERRKTFNPHIDLAYRLAKSLDVPIHHIFPPEHAVED